MTDCGRAAPEALAGCDCVNCRMARIEDALARLSELVAGLAVLADGRSGRGKAAVTPTRSSPAACSSRRRPRG